MTDNEPYDENAIFERVLATLRNEEIYWIDDGYRLYLFERVDRPITIFDLINHKNLAVWHTNGPFAMNAMIAGENILYRTISAFPFNFVLNLFNTKRARLWKAAEKVRASDRCYKYRYET